MHDMRSAWALTGLAPDRGEATLVRPGDEYEVVAKNRLGEPISSSPAISQGQIFVRTHQALYCIGKKK